MPLAPTRELVLKKIRDCFPDPVVASEALAILDTYGAEAWQRFKEPVQLAILKTSSTNLDKLRLCTRGARSDSRGIMIVAACYEQSQASSKTPPDEMSAIQKRDREDYERWLALPLASRELVLKKAHDCFTDPATARNALAVLDSYGTEHWHREIYRVRLALLRISSGDFDKLCLCTQAAQSEFRKTLASAECVEASQAAPSTSPQEMAEIRMRDMENYERWLLSNDG